MNFFKPNYVTHLLPTVPHPISWLLSAKSLCPIAYVYKVTRSTGVIINSSLTLENVLSDFPGRKLGPYNDYNPYDSSTSSPLTKLRAWQIKTACNQLPTIDILDRNYPKIIYKCTAYWWCNNVSEINDHIWSCETALRIFAAQLRYYICELKTFLINNSDQGDYQLHEELETTDSLIGFTKKILTSQSTTIYI
ncbi:ribonuclease H-like domain-containing protein [Rhizophagus clarus]|uniref:Ribonuclease H-like domain-containing protein n=1 Tax=Rhizophagus clarus TaxID=94130 RepID=A0A8H3LTM4_9GLOM|nr:ribonuclease H-like domain-containing protein [Rhizophagus clarus]